MRCVWCGVLIWVCVVHFWVFGECVFSVCVCAFLTSFLGLWFCTAVDLLAEQYLSRVGPGLFRRRLLFPLFFVLTCSSFLNLMLPR